MAYNYVTYWDIMTKIIQNKTNNGLLECGVSEGS